MTQAIVAAPPEPITGRTRSTIVDIVKGIAIALVVYGHTAQGMVHRGWWDGPSAVFSDSFVYSFHMPAFFFVAGLFLVGSLERRGSRLFTLDKLKTILYPYILWLVLSALIEPAIGRFKVSHQPFDWGRFLLGVVDGEASWFLPTLFACQILALGTWKVPAWLRLGVSVLVAMIVTSYGPALIHRPAQEFCFLAAGMLVGSGIFALERMPAWISGLAAVALFALQAAVILRDGENAQFGSPHQWLAVILGFTGTAGLVMLARLLDHTRIGDAWAWVGRASLGVFLLSPFVQGGVRELLARLGHIQGLWPQLLLPTLFAILIPVVIWNQQERWRIGWLFHWPAR